MAAFASFGQGVEEQLSGYSAHVAEALAGTLAAPAAALLTCWFTWRAWTILFSGRGGSLAELFLDVSRAALVAFFALSAPRFVSLVIPAVTGCEAWLLSAHPDGPSFVQNGVYAGKTLAEK